LKASFLISVKANGNTTVFELNASPVLKDLCGQLPLKVKVENFGSNDKIIYQLKSGREHIQKMFGTMGVGQHELITI
jgi:hypothetical protein